MPTHVESPVNVCFGVECPAFMAEVQAKLVPQIGSMAATEYAEGQKDNPTFKNCLMQEGCRIEQNLASRAEEVQNA